MAYSSLFSHANPPQVFSWTNNETGTYAVGLVVTPAVKGDFTSIWYYVGEDELGTVAAKVHVYQYAYVNTLPDNQTPYISEDFFFRNTIGWQEVALSNPVSVTAGTRYVISVSFPSSGAYYSAVANVFQQDVTSGNLTAESRAAVHNGRYSDLNGNSLEAQYPMKNYSTASYCVDVTFDSGWASQSINHFIVTEARTLSPLDVTIVS